MAAHRERCCPLGTFQTQGIRNTGKRTYVSKFCRVITFCITNTWRWHKNITIFSYLSSSLSPLLLLLSSRIPSSNFDPEARCLGCDTVKSGTLLPKFRRNLPPLSSGYRVLFETTVTIYQTTRCLADVSSTFLAFSIVFSSIFTFFSFFPPSYSFLLHSPLLIVSIEQQL